MNPIVTVENLSFGYGGLPVLEEATFSVAEHDLVCLVGPNGGGKTTLLKLILGLLKPAAGQVRVFGLPPERARARVGYVPQRPQHDLSFPVTVIDVVLMGRLGSSRGWGPHSRADREAAMRALQDVGLAELAAKSFAAISAGQRQRVLIARALASEADLLILDEPTANVDALVEQEIYALLRRISRRATVVFVSHDLHFVTSYVERAICVNRRVAVHPVREITGELIGQLYGPAWRIVRHDQCEEGEQRCLTF
jgi:zinc transport system ATP-binding protein